MRMDYLYSQMILTDSVIYVFIDIHSEKIWARFWCLHVMQQLRKSIKQTRSINKHRAVDGLKTSMHQNCLMKFSMDLFKQPRDHQH